MTKMNAGFHTLNKEVETQKSLPAYIYGTKLAQMIKQLE